MDSLNSIRLGSAYQDDIQSKAIDLLRFPLAVLVVFIHMSPQTVPMCNADYRVLSNEGLYNVFALLFSNVLGGVAVPCFYVISGYLFFYKIENFTWDAYAKKMRNRLRTLIIPYILWNVFAALLMSGYLFMSRASVVEAQYPISWHVLIDWNDFTSSANVNWLGHQVPSTAPYDLPLWFLRDLIVVSCLSPLIYYFVKFTKFWGVVFLFLAYISRVWLTISGFSCSAFFFFSLGTYLSINKINMAYLAKKLSAISIPISMLWGEIV